VDERSGGSDLYSVDAASGRVRQLTRNAFDGASPASFYSPAWSPDGRRIAFTRSPMGLMDPKSELFVMNADGSSQRRLTRHFRDNYPAWSPDGTKIVFVRAWKEGKASELDVIDADGRGRLRLATGNVSGLPEWSPNGNQIAFQRGAGLWIVNADGSGERRVAQKLVGLSGPIWRPGG
jgi:TolB protein